MEANIEIPDEMFEIPKNVTFKNVTITEIDVQTPLKSTQPESRNVVSTEPGTVPDEVILVVVVSPSAGLHSGDDVVSTLHSGDVATIVKREGFGYWCRRPGIADGCAEEMFCLWKVPTTTLSQGSSRIRMM